ncbi:hypothetical protein MKW94_026472 [Papaver nudicaule]|uniref:Uncharacterized protein n=1 Tax=Papaver nudicaule TaxID=74823 RepID=A0AA41SKD9_PAPNU|nr:hypothetical protein [Papaver nudicaule]
MSHYLWRFLTVCFHFIAYKSQCKSDIPLGYKVTLPIPSNYNSGCTGRAFLMETDQITLLLMLVFHVHFKFFLESSKAVISASLITNFSFVICRVGFYGRDIISVELGSTGLKLFDKNHRKFAQISSRKYNPTKFLALSETNENLGVFHYSLQMRRFFFNMKGYIKASFKALNEICDLPLACGKSVGLGLFL